jgi:hypothetical protein
LPDQTDFDGTLYLGEGGGSLSHISIGNGQDNTAMGIGALYSNTTEGGNTASCYQALQSNTTGQGNTALGSGADVASENLVNATAIGYSAKVNASNKVFIGDPYVTWIGGYVGWWTSSDARFKHNVREDIMGVDFITRLRPVSYKMDIAALNTHLSVKTNSNMCPIPARAISSARDSSDRKWKPLPGKLATISAVSCRPRMTKTITACAMPSLSCPWSRRYRNNRR